MARLVLVTQSLRNPLALLWSRALRLVGHDVVTLLALPKDSEYSPARSPEMAAWLGLEAEDALVQVERGPLAGADAQRLARALGGAPDILLHWWGMGALRLSHLYQGQFPDAANVLLIDTLPATARAVTETREMYDYARLGRRMDGFWTTSAAMTARLHRLLPAKRCAPVLQCVQPLPLRTHADAPVQRAGDSAQPRLIFQGRSDAAFTRRGSMLKDAVGAQLTSFVDAGAEVHVSGYWSGDCAPKFPTYRTFSNADVMNGAFASFVSEFDGQLVLYNAHNRTIRRRVGASLSSRFSIGLASASPIFAMQSAAAREFLEVYQVGSIGSPSELSEFLDNSALYRSNWALQHEAWSAEGQRERLNRFLRQLS
jgi:hypothetical protein